MNETKQISKSVAQKRATRCRNFNGIQHDKCEAGVCYKTLQGDGMALPCLPWHCDDDRPVAKCGQYGVYTAEEIAEQEREIDRSINGIVTARKAVVAELKRRALEKDPNVRPLDPANEHRWHKPQDNYYAGAGEMACPVCGAGKLRYSRSGYNGHIHAACSTDGCVAWME
jgi:hypothetical protein